LLLITRRVINNPLTFFARAPRRGVMGGGIRPAELTLSGVLEKRTSARCASSCLAVDSRQQVIGHRDQDLRHNRE
jgi:hypothetical protein